MSTTHILSQKIQVHCKKIIRLFIILGVITTQGVLYAQSNESCMRLDVSTNNHGANAYIWYNCIWNWSVQSYKIDLKDAGGRILQSQFTAQWSFQIPEEGGSKYYLSCYINGQSDTTDWCDRTLNVSYTNFEWSEAQQQSTSTIQEWHSYELWEGYNGTNFVQNIQITTIPNNTVSHTGTDIWNIQSGYYGSGVIQTPLFGGIWSTLLGQYGSQIIQAPLFPWNISGENSLYTLNGNNFPQPTQWHNMNTRSDMIINVHEWRASVECYPLGRYSLNIWHNSIDIGTLESNDGNFNFSLKSGNYTLECINKSTNIILSWHRKKITVDSEKWCSLKSTIQYGGAPLKSKLSCRHPEYDECKISLLKDGRLLNYINDCTTEVIIEDKWVYDVTCEVWDEYTSEVCYALIEVDVMTNPKTGPFLPILIIISIILSGTYYTYLRRRTQ